MPTYDSTKKGKKKRKTEARVGTSLGRRMFLFMQGAARQIMLGAYQFYIFKFLFQSETCL